MDNASNIQGLEGAGDIAAMYPCPQWFPSGEKKVEAPFTNVPHITQSDAFVAIDRRRFPTTGFRRGSGFQQVTTTLTKGHLHSLTMQEPCRHVSTHVERHGVRYAYRL